MEDRDAPRLAAPADLRHAPKRITNNAGITQPRQLRDISKSGWDAVLAVSLPGAKDTYRPMGYPGFTYAAPIYYGALQLKRAVAYLEGGPEPKHNDVQPLP